MVLILFFHLVEVRVALGTGVNFLDDLNILLGKPVALHLRFIELAVLDG